MKDEIKEILDKLKKLCYDDYCLEFSVDYIERKEEKLLLECITNLQEKVNQYENPDDMTLFYMWLDTEAKDKMKQLEQENKFAKEYEKQYRIEKSRIDKANWWLKEMLKQAKSDETKAIINGTLELLTGGDEE